MIRKAKDAHDDAPEPFKPIKFRPMGRALRRHIVKMGQMEMPDFEALAPVIKVRKRVNV